MYHASAGLYLASAGADKQMVVWELHTKSRLASKELPAEPLSMSWKPEGNTLLCATTAGKLVLWEGCIPKGHTGPLEAADSPLKRAHSSAQESGKTSTNCIVKVEMA